MILGPESTGKSTVAAQLATHYNTVWVPEFARKYLAGLSRPYQEEDLLHIAKEQMKQEDKLEKQANQLLICDTGLEVIKVWSEHRFGRTHSWIEEKLDTRYYDQYLLMQVDLPWQPDPLREHPHLRTYFFDWYKESLNQKGVFYTIIEGDEQARVLNAIKSVDNLLGKK